ncbi:GNAT family N-acetyltransferase [Metabacillus idriensis]|uniref:GNAT family N-acetyltransferase n=1 Tax=Metabacillus idriensis TaxID=324768 RepID=UPI003D816976
MDWNNYLTNRKNHKRAELAYWFGVPFWGRGYAAEAIDKVLEFGFKDIELNRIWATVMKKNNTIYSGENLRMSNTMVY